MLGSPSLVSRVRSLNYAVACEGDGGNCDGGTDGGRDGGPDSGHDGGSDAGRDGGTDGGRDGGRDGGPDGGQDGGPDGGRDGGCDPAAMQAAALRGEAVDPGACKWNIPPDTRNVLPINKIYDVGPANLIVKSQESQITDYEICSVDNKKTSSGSIQGCWRYAVNLMGACVAGSGGSTTEDGSCQTPLCPCDGADGECREPSCTMHKDNKQSCGGCADLDGQPCLDACFRTPGVMRAGQCDLSAAVPLCNLSAGQVCRLDGTVPRCQSF